MNFFRTSRIASILLAAAHLHGTAAQAHEAPVQTDVPIDTAAVEPARDRLLPLEGGINFRDLGGYRTEDGRTVKWGKLFRSGTMNRLTQKDFAYLSSRGLETVIDLRSTGERVREPVAWPRQFHPTVMTRDYEMDMGTLDGLLARPGVTVQEVRAEVAAGYREVPINFAPQYRVLIGELLSGGDPLAFNCSAGKDRTGVGAAIVLSVLGVPRETIIQDYLLSNRYFRPDLDHARDNPAMAAMFKLPPDIRQALMGVDRSYLEAAFAGMDAFPGGIAGYYSEKLGLTPSEIAELRARLLDGSAHPASTAR